jgi:hypothetical protein
MKLREIDSKPVSRSFDNFDKIPIVIEDIGKILVSNNDVVITSANRQKINFNIMLVNHPTTLNY